MVIQRLESESNSSTSDATRKYRMDIERMKSETAEEVKHLRDQHSMALDKVLSAQSAINQLEDHRRQLQKDILQLQHEVAAKDATVRQQKHELSRLKVDEQTLINTIRREFNEQLDAKELAIQHLSDQMGMLHEQTDVLRRKYQQEIDAIVKDKDASMMQIEDRVKQALRQKDEMIASLKAQQEELLIRNGHLETLMEKQRHELLG
ncbi:hypothetical protein BC831DRAFT_160540 [Entophlyctis helioformis]|nr:hypothetical protein BC831DRAFT_160540 [Entophlyctis helioformis]